MSVKHIAAVLFTTLMAGAMPLGHALDFAEGKLRLSGFASLGAVTTSTDEIAYRRNFADPSSSQAGEINLSSLSLMGLQMNYTPHPKLGFIGQIVLRDQPEFSNDTLVKIAAINLNPTPDWQIRLGRTSPRFYMLSDSEHIAYTHLWTMPVQEFYAPVSTNYIDGLDTTYTFALADGFLNVNAGYGKAVFVIQDDFVGAVKLELNEVHAMNIEYTRYDWLVRASWAQTNRGKDWQSLNELQAFTYYTAEQLMWTEGYAIANELTIENSKIRYTSVGLNYDNGIYTVSSELGSFTSTSAIITSTVNGYLSIGRNFGNYTPYILFSKTHSTDEYTIEGPAPAQAQALLQQVLPVLNPSYDQESISFGVRWNVHAQAAIKAQWDFKNIDNNGYGLWREGENNSYPIGDKSVSVYSVRMDFIF